MKNLFIFLGGAAVGSAITWKIIEKRYQDLADEEIQSVVDTFKNREKELKKSEEKVEDIEENKDNVKLHYDNTIDAMKYVSDDIKNMEENLINPKKETKSTSKINVISPEEFGEKDGYDTKSYTLWNDGVLTDEFDIVIESPKKVIGDALKHFGEYEDDAVYVRNTNLKCDYEILKSEKDFNS